MQRRPRGLSANYANEDERVQELLNDKSVLALPLLSRDNWIRNDQRPQCYFCQRKFRPLVRPQHHCRGCGEVVCRACNRHRKVRTGPPPSQRTRNVRLCVDCIDKATIAASKDDVADASFRAEGDGALADNAPTSDCSFLYNSLRESSNADTMRSSASVRSYSSSASASLASLERSASESSAASAASFEWESTTSSSHSNASSRSRSRNVSRIGATTSRLGPRNSAHAGHSPQHQHHRPPRRGDQDQRRRSQPIEFLPESEQFEIYEVRRQELLALYGIVDSEPQTEYDALCELASRALECTVAAVAFMDSTRQWYKARVGIAQSELPRNVAFCSQVLQSSLPTLVMDASLDPRFNSNPLVTSSASIRFYATTPICDPGTGIVIGSVFVMDRKPKTELPPRAMEILAYLSIAAEKLLLSGTLRAKMRKPPQEQKREEAVRKRKHRVHSAPTITSANEPERPAIRAASLQCVPEELETKDDVSHAIPRNTRERELYKLVDPDVLLPHSLSRRSSESELLSTRGSGGFSSPSRAGTIAVPPPPRAQRRMSVSSARWLEQSSAPPTSSSSRDVATDDTHLDLLSRISATQELLAQQRELLMTLSASPSSVGAIGETMGHIESAMRTLSVANSRLRSSSSSSTMSRRSSKRRGEVEV